MIGVRCVVDERPVVALGGLDRIRRDDASVDLRRVTVASKRCHNDEIGWNDRSRTDPRPPPASRVIVVVCGLASSDTNNNNKKRREEREKKQATALPNKPTRTPTFFFDATRKRPRDDDARAPLAPPLRARTRPVRRRAFDLRPGVHPDRRVA
jgi:hypothetical protein